jgi:sialate O-acetylesterase
MTCPIPRFSSLPVGLLFSAACLCLSLLRAEVNLSPFFAPGMVLQSEAPLAVWGSATPGENIRVSLGESAQEVSADREGRWRVAFAPLPRGNEPYTLRVSGSNTLELHPVWIGDLFAVAGEIPATSAPASPPEPTPENVSVFTVRPGSALLTSSQLEGEWSRTSAHPFALALAAELQARSGYPMGLILLSAPGNIETWIPEDLLADTPAAAPLVKVYEAQGLSSAVEQNRKDYEQRLADWRRAGQNLPLEPEERPLPQAPAGRWQQAPSSRFNAMAAPLAGFPVRGLFWMHGHDEESVGRADQTGELIPSALKGFRRLLRRDSLPVQILQTGSQRFRRLDNRAAAELREAQWDLQSHPANRVLVSLDLGPAPDRRILTDRMADAMLSQLRGDREGISPSPSSIHAIGNSMYLTFRDTSGGLRSTEGPLRGFALQDGARWVWADARVEGDRIRLDAPGVTSPSAVRYAWQDLPVNGATLVNGRGLPAPSFRSDEAPPVTRRAVKPGELRRHSTVSELYIEDPRLPRVLVIGDSVAIGQIPTLRRLFAGKANIIVGNHYRGAGFYTTANALKDQTLEQFLEATGPYDVIQFNMGIHEFASQRAPEKTAPAYGERLRKIVSVLRNHHPGTDVIWCSSTGSHADGQIPRFPEYLSAAKAYNAAAARVMQELNVPVTDLFGYTQPEVKRYIGGDFIHLRLEVKPEISDFMAENIRKALNN